MKYLHVTVIIIIIQKGNSKQNSAAILIPKRHRFVFDQLMQYAVIYVLVLSVCTSDIIKNNQHIVNNYHRVDNHHRVNNHQKVDNQIVVTYRSLGECREQSY